MTNLSNLAGDSLTDDSVLDTLTFHSVPGNPLTPSDSLTGDSVLDTLTPHSVPGALSDDGGDSLTTDSVLDTLPTHSVPIVVGLDWERDGWRVSIAGAPAVRVIRDVLLVTDFPDADLVVVEQAHMRERDIYSVAQVYTIEQLTQLPFRNKLRLFPGMPGQLAKAARAVGNIELDEHGAPVMKKITGTDHFATVPDKAKDAETMAMYAAANPARVASWKRYCLPGEDPSRRLWPYRDQLRTDLQAALNPLRSAWNALGTSDKYALPEVERFIDVLDAVFDDLTPGIKEQFGIRRGKMLTAAGKPTAFSRTAKGIRVERMAAALTAYLSVYTRDGELRVRPDGEFIGVRFILDSIGLSNSYRPNMARSQLTHHGMRHYKGGRDGGFRSEYMKNLRHFLAIMRDAAGDSLTRDSVLDTLTDHSVPGGGQDSLPADSVPAPNLQGGCV